TDGGSGPTTQTHSLSTSVSDGTETANASTDSHAFSDVVGNSATAGPVGGFKIDKKAPTYSCDPASSTWSATDVTRACTGADGGSGLTPASDSSFSLSTSVPAGTETANAQTDSKTLIDGVGHSTVIGPLGGNKVDK